MVEEVKKRQAKEENTFDFAPSSAFGSGAFVQPTFGSAAPIATTGFAVPFGNFGGSEPGYGGFKFGSYPKELNTVIITAEEAKARHMTSLTTMAMSKISHLLQLPSDQQERFVSLAWTQVRGLTMPRESMKEFSTLFTEKYHYRCEPSTDYF